MSDTDVEVCKRGTMVLYPFCSLFHIVSFKHSVRKLQAKHLYYFCVGLCCTEAQKQISSQVTPWLYCVSLFCFLSCCLCTVGIVYPAPVALGISYRPSSRAEEEGTSSPEGHIDVSWYFD